MKTTSNSAANDIGKNEDRAEAKNEEVTPQRSAVSRRYFLGKSIAVETKPWVLDKKLKRTRVCRNVGGRIRRVPRLCTTPLLRPGDLSSGAAPLSQFLA